MSRAIGIPLRWKPRPGFSAEFGSKPHVTRVFQKLITRAKLIVAVQNRFIVCKED